MLQFPVSAALPPLPPFGVPPAPSLSPFISLFHRNLAPSYFQLTKWEPVRREGNGGRRGEREREERKRGREEEKECLLHISAITLTTLLPFLMFFRVSWASRGRHLIVITSVSAARTHAHVRVQTLPSRPDERCIQGLRQPQEGKYMCEGKKLTEPHFSSHQTALPLLRLPSPCFTSPPPLHLPSPFHLAVAVNVTGNLEVLSETNCDVNAVGSLQALADSPRPVISLH